MVYRSYTNLLVCVVLLVAVFCLLLFTQLGKERGWKRCVMLAAAILFVIGGVMQFVPFSLTDLQSGTLMMRQPDLDRNVELESNGKTVLFV